MAHKLQCGEKTAIKSLKPLNKWHKTESTITVIPMRTRPTKRMKKAFVGPENDGVEKKVSVAPVKAVPQNVRNDAVVKVPAKGILKASEKITPPTNEKDSRKVMFVEKEKEKETEKEEEKDKYFSFLAYDRPINRQPVVVISQKQLNKYPLMLLTVLIKLSGIAEKSLSADHSYEGDSVAVKNAIPTQLSLSALEAIQTFVSEGKWPPMNDLAGRMGVCGDIVSWLDFVNHLRFTAKQIASFTFKEAIVARRPDPIKPLVILTAVDDLKSPHSEEYDGDNDDDDNEFAIPNDRLSFGTKGELVLCWCNNPDKCLCSGLSPSFAVAPSVTPFIPRGDRYSRYGVCGGPAVHAF